MKNLFSIGYKHPTSQVFSNENIAFHEIGLLELENTTTGR